MSMENSCDPTYDAKLKNLRDMILAEWKEIVDAGLGLEEFGGAQLQLLGPRIQDNFERSRRCPSSERDDNLKRFGELLSRVKKFSGRMIEKASHGESEKSRKPDIPAFAQQAAPASPIPDQSEHCGGMPTEMNGAPGRNDGAGERSGVRETEAGQDASGE
ncbi:MAG: hypothetical protein LBE84_12640, partial [Planctomycetota bacterium]|nr:hypothetical protein [Planctomycetota bacterium]